MKKRIVRGLIVGFAVFLVALLLHYLNLFRSLEWKSWDLRLRLFSQSSQASGDIVLFLIDQESLDVYEQEQGLPWPWPRQIYSAIINYCSQANAKALVFDMIFSESSGYGVEDDEDFSQAMAESGNVFLPVFLSLQEKGEQEIPIQDLEKSSLRREKLPREEKLPNKAIYPVRSVTLPLEILLGAARGVGNVRFSPDGDGIYRRLPMLFDYESLIIPALPLAVADFIKGRQSIEAIPLDHSGQMIIRFYGPTGTYKSYSIAAIINSYAQMLDGKTPQVPPAEFAGKIILVGATAPGLFDLRPSPFSAVYPGVETLATVLDNLLQEDFIRMASQVSVVFLLIGLSLLTGLGTTLLRDIWKIVLFFLLCLAIPAGIATLAFLKGYWVEFVAPEFAVLLSFIGASLLNYRFEGKRRRFIKNVFRHYLSPHVIERIIENPDLLQLGGEKREITSFFSDVAAFTSVAEELSPEDLVNLLNDYLSEMTEIILSSGGTLDKYEGDAIIAFWNAPLEQPDHALRACRAALKCQMRLEEMRPDLQSQYGHALSMRIGINSGSAVVGNMGSRKRFDYTAMGDTVNLASRLEGACKQYKVPILIGEETFERVKNHMVSREVDIIRVVGRKESVAVFEIIGERGDVLDSELEKISSFEQALEVYRKGEWREALSLFQKFENDMLAQVYVDRCQKLIESGSKEGWTGIYDLKEK